MKKHLFIKLLGVLILSLLLILIYRSYIVKDKITYIYKYSQIQIPLNNKTKLNSNSIKNISIKDENNNNIYAYVFLSVDGKILMINPPVDGFHENSTISVETDQNNISYFKVKKHKQIKTFKSIGEPKYGDIVGTTGKFMEYQYDHMGIYIGNNKVIHYCSSTGNALDAKIQETDMESYFKKGNYFILNIKNTPLFNGEKTVERAKTRLGEKNYNLLQNNCEHFAIWCKTNYSESLQLENLSQKQMVQIKIITSLGINLQ